MNSELYERLKIEVEGVRLEEVLSAAEIERMRGELSEPEIRPCDFDLTLDGWLARIETWGKVTIQHKDPENFWGKKKITIRQFLDRMQTDHLNKILGQWSIKKNGLTKCTFTRDYIGVDNRHYIEKFIVDVKLRKELR